MGKSGGNMNKLRKAPKFQNAPPKPKRPSPPRHEPTATTRAAVAAMAATFLSHDLIALQLAISKPTLLKYYRLELDTAIERANATVVSRLHKLTDKHPVACFYWLGNRAADHWKNVNKTEHTHDVDGKLGSLADLVMKSYQQPAAPGAAPAVTTAPAGPSFTEPKAPK